MRDRHIFFGQQQRQQGRIPRRLLAGRHLDKKNVDVVFAIAAILALVATSVFGTFAALIFVLSSLAILVVTPKRTADDILRFSPLICLPLLAAMSTLWSDAPERTIRASLQLIVTFTAAIVICRRTRPESFIAVLFIGFFLTCMLLTIEIPSALAHNQPLDSAYLGSKNQVGFDAHMLLALAIAVAIDARSPLFVRWMSLPAIILGIGVLVLSRSAGAETSLAVTLCTFPIFVMLGRFSMPVRIVIILVSLIFMTAALVFLPEIQHIWSDFRTNVLKKDATLTGRTYLWDFASHLIDERPYFGTGYYAFWRQGNIDAEGLWRWGGIKDRAGFNFHNAYIEMLVDLGWIGGVIFVLTCAVNGILIGIKQLVSPSPSSAFLLSMVLVIYIRGYTESGLIAPFSILTLIWIACAIYGCDGIKIIKHSNMNNSRASPRVPRGGGTKAVRVR